MRAVSAPWVWPYARLDEALAALVRQSGLGTAPSRATFTPPAIGQTDAETLSRWVERLAGWLGVEAEPIEANYPELEQLVRGAAPALLQVPCAGAPGFVAVVRGGRSLRVLTTELEVVELPAAELCAALARVVEAPAEALVEAVLEAAQVPATRRARARGALLREWLKATPVAACWLLRVRPGDCFLHLLRHARAGRKLTLALLAYALQAMLGIGGFWLLGRGAFEGRLEQAWLLAWVLVQLSTLPLTLLSTWAWGELSIDLGVLFKQRLLAGALALDPEHVRQQGAGQLLGRVLDARALETLSLTGGFAALVSTLDLVLAALVLSAGVAGTLHVLLLAGWSLLSLGIGAAYLARWRRWTALRVEITNELVEGMVGHRTRLAQEPLAQWHAAEDHGLERYLAQSIALDRTALWAGAVLSRGWLLVGLAALVPAFVAGGASAPRLAVSVGGVLLASRAMRGLVGGLTSLAGAIVAGENVGPLLRTANQHEPVGSPVLAAAVRPELVTNEPVLEAHELVYRYPSRPVPALRGVDLTIAHGDRVLIEGPSGGGKSTLGAVLMGLRAPESGTLLLRGLDRASWGSEGWRRGIAGAPQFHENHVVSATLAFNLLLGRRWPPRPDDLAQAEAVCRALELGPLLDRMPAGLEQLVGETGWQLSHGERSRLYVARALLQQSDLAVFDESFAALDPATLQAVLACVFAHAPTSVVIAHP